MARSQKLEKNLSKVQGMLDGNHDKKLIFGHESENIHANKKVGDKWTDSDGTQWEQKDGYRSKVSSTPNIGIADTCPDCEAYVTKPWDKDSYKSNGRCYYCQIDFEANFSRHMVGSDSKFKEFEDGKLKWSDFSDEEKQNFLDKNLDGQTKYKIERMDGYIKGFVEEQEIWEKEMREGDSKVFDKSVANALANAEIDTTNVKLKNNTK
jgi:hypothetical protein